MATNNIEDLVKKENPILKKRTAPEDVVATSETVEKKSPLKKRTTPLDEPNAEKSVASLMKKRELPTEEKEATSPLKKKNNPFDTKEEPKEKSSLDKMRERIAAQKKLEQDMMTQQSLRNQEKVSMRNKLSALTKDLSEASDEEEITPKVKPVINTDLKTEALEMQNKKLKADLDKSKKQLQALLSLEYQNMRVLDSSSLSLSDEFLQNLNNIKAEYEAQKNLEEQTLKEELNALQKELSDVKNKNAAAKKASDDARKAAAQAEKAIEEAKRVIQDQENDQIRNFKEEISELEKQIKAREKELVSLTKEKENIILEFEQKINELTSIKEEQEKRIETLNKTVEEQEKQKEEVNNLTNALNEMKVKFNDQELAFQSQLKTEVDKSLAQVSILENQLKELDSVKEQNIIFSNENKQLKDKLQEQKEEVESANKKLEITIKNQNEELESIKEKFQIQVDAQEKQNKQLNDQISDLQKQLQTKENDIVVLNTTILSLPTENQVSDLQNKINTLEESLSDKEVFEEKYNVLLKTNSTLEEHNQNLLLQLEQLNIQLQSKLAEEQKQQELQNSEIMSQINAIQEEINQTQDKINNNNVVKKELVEQYQKFVSSKEKLENDFAAVRKYVVMHKETLAARKVAEDIAIEVSLINPKIDKKAYKAKLAESKSMNSKAIYLEKQFKKLNKNKNVSEYVKVLSKVNEFDSQFAEITSRNNNLQNIIDQKIEEINSLKG